MQAVTKKLPTFLKWAGGKSWLAPRIAELYHGSKSDRFIDLFAGGLSVSLEVQAKRAIVNDFNPYLITLYKVIREGLILPIDIEAWNTKERYYQIREEFNQLIGDKTVVSVDTAIATYFYYLNRTDFRGMCRFNQSGGFNVPFGNYQTPLLYRDFEAYSELFQSWLFRAADFRDLFTTSAIESGDFIYSDPPYDDGFCGYTPEGFSFPDQVKLVQLLADHPGPVVASNKCTGRMLDLYSGFGFKVEILDGPRSLAVNGNRECVKEIFATRNL